MSERADLSSTMRIDLIPGTQKKAPPQVRKSSPQDTAAPRRGSASHEPEIPASSPYYHRLLQGMYDATLITDLGGRIVDVNWRAIDFLQYSIEELRSLSIFDVVWGAEPTLIDTLCRNLEDQRHTLIQAYCRRKNDSYFPAEIAVTKLELESIQLGFFIRDITVRRHAEELLLTEHCAIQNSGSGIAITDLSGVIEFANPAADHMWNIAPPDRLTGKALSELLVDNDQSAALVARLLQQRESWTGDARARRGDGTEFDVQISGSPNRNSDGEMVGFVLSFINISDRKRAEQAELELERRRVMLESLGAACHHLGQPATVLLANLEVLKKLIPPENTQPAHLVDTSLAAMSQLGDILRRLNSVCDYRTESYLDAAPGESLPESRIIDI